MAAEQLIVVARRVRGRGFRATLPSGDAVEAATIAELHEGVKRGLDAAALHADGVSSLRLEFTARRPDGLPACWRADVIAVDVAEARGRQDCER